MEAPEDFGDDLMGIERPVSDVELEPEYGNYADIYYGEEGDEEIPDYSATAEDEAFSAEMFGDGFFAKHDSDGDSAAADTEEQPAEEQSAEEKPAEDKPAAKKTAARKPAAKKKAAKKTAAKKSSKKDGAADPDKHEENKGDGFTVKL